MIICWNIGDGPYRKYLRWACGYPQVHSSVLIMLNSARFLQIPSMSQSCAPVLVFSFELRQSCPPLKSKSLMAALLWRVAPDYPSLCPPQQWLLIFSFIHNLFNQSWVVTPKFWPFSPSSYSAAPPRPPPSTPVHLPPRRSVHSMVGQLRSLHHFSQLHHRRPPLNFPRSHLRPIGCFSRTQRRLRQKNSIFFGSFHSQWYKPQHNYGGGQLKFFVYGIGVRCAGQCHLRLDLAGLIGYFCRYEEHIFLGS